MRQITSISNPLIKELRSLREKKYREKYGRYLVEGEKVVQEALDSPVLIAAVVTSQPELPVVLHAESLGLDVVEVPRAVLEQIGDTKTPPNVMACLQKSTIELPPDGSFYVIADGVRDPKNLGTIIRTADAAGSDGVVLSADCADPYGPKCQRAAMGSTLHLGVEVRDVAQFLREFRGDGGTVVSGLLEGSDSLENTFSRACVVVGNESRGVSECVRSLTDIAYRIPIYGRCDSLNVAVAAGIMMYDIRRRLEQRS